MSNKKIVIFSVCLTVTHLAMLTIGINMSGKELIYLKCTYPEQQCITQNKIKRVVFDLVKECKR